MASPATKATRRTKKAAKRATKRRKKSPAATGKVALTKVAEPMAPFLGPALPLPGRVEVSNKTSLTLDVSWVAPDGQRRRRASLAAGKTRRFAAVRGHVWVVDDAYSGQELGSVVVAKPVEKLIIDGTALRPFPGKGKVDLTLQNGSPVPVDSSQVDEKGRDTGKKSLAPGAAQQLSARPGDVFRFRQKGKGELGVFIVGAAPVQTHTFALQSFRGLPATKLTFHNLTPLTLELFLRGGPKQEWKFAELAPGATHVQPTFDTHRWVLRDRQSGKLIQSETAREQPRQVPVEARLLRAERETKDSKKVSVSFENATPFTLDLCPVDAEGKEHAAATLEPGEKIEKESVALQPWRFRRRMGRVEVDLYVAGDKPKQQHISRFQSVSGGAPTSVRFENDTMLTLDVLLLDEAAKPKKVAELPPGARLEQAATVGQAFIVRDVASGFIVDHALASEATLSITIDSRDILPSAAITPVSVTFENALPFAVDLFRVAASGAEELLTGLEPGQRTVQSTYAGCPWRVREQSSKLIVAVLIPTDKPKQDINLALCSPPSKQATEITFSNQSPLTVKVCWIDVNGSEQVYKVLRPYSSFIAPTYVSHFWLVREATTGRPLLLTRGVAVPQKQIVTGGNLRSLDTGSARSVKIKNTCAYSVDLYPLGSDGVEGKKTAIARGKTFTANGAKPGHVFRAKKADTDLEIGLFVVGGAKQLTVVDTTVRRPTLVTAVLPLPDRTVIGSGDAACAFAGSLGSKEPVFSDDTVGSLKGILTDCPLVDPDAALDLGKGRIALFQGEQYLEWDSSKNKAIASPVPIEKTFKNLGLSSVEAALQVSPTEAVFFQGNQAIKYDVKAKKRVGRPGTIGSLFKGVRFKRLDAAVRGTDESLWFFCEDQFACIPGKPGKLPRMPSLPETPDLPAGVTAPGGIKAMPGFPGVARLPGGLPGANPGVRAAAKKTKRRPKTGTIQSLSGADVALPRVELGEGDVAAYADRDYAGTCWIIRSDQPDLGIARLKGLGDNIASFRLGPNTAVTAFVDKNYRGTDDVIYLNTPSLEGTDVGIDRISSLKLFRTVTQGASEIKSTTKLCQEAYQKGRKIEQRTVYRTTFTFPLDVKQIELFGTEQADIEVRGKKYRIDAVKPARLTPNDLSQLVVTMDASAMGLAGLQLHTNAMAEGARLLLFPEEDLHKKLSELEDGALYENRKQLGVKAEVTEKDCEGVQQALQNLAQTVRRGLSTPGEQLVIADNMDYQSWGVDFGAIGQEGALFQPLTTEEARGILAGGARIDEPVAQGLKVGKWLKDRAKDVSKSKVGKDIGKAGQKVGKEVGDSKLVKDIGKTGQKVGKDIGDSKLVKDVGKVGKDIGDSKVGKDIGKGIKVVVAPIESAGKEFEQFGNKLVTAVADAKNPADALRRVGGVFIEVGIAIGGEVYKFVADTVDKVVAAMEFMVEQIGVLAGKFIDWLKEILGWDAILETHDFLMDMFNGGFDKIGELLKLANEAAKDGLTQVDKTLDSALGQVHRMLGTDEIVNKYSERNTDSESKKTNYELPDEVAWLLDKLSSGGNAVKLPSLASGSTAGVTSTLDKLGKAIDDLGDRFSEVSSSLAACGELFEKAGKKLAEGKLEAAGKYLAGALLQVFSVLADVALGAIGMLLDLVFELLELVVAGIQKLFNAKIKIPFVSGFYEMITGGRDLSTGSVVCLVLAIPTTLIGRAILGEPPFKGVAGLQRLEEDDPPSRRRGATIFYAVCHLVLGLTGGIERALGYQENINKAENPWGKWWALFNSFVGALAQLAGSPLKYSSIFTFVESAKAARSSSEDPPVRAAAATWWYQWGLAVWAIASVFINEFAKLSDTWKKRIAYFTTAIGTAHLAMLLWTFGEEVKDGGTDDGILALHFFAYFSDALPNIIAPAFETKDPKQFIAAAATESIAHWLEGGCVIGRIVEKDY